MRIFGLEIKRAKTLSPVPSYRGGWRRILESFPGAWQQNVEETRGDVLCYPALFACISRRSQDIAKLPFMLQREDAQGIWTSVDNPAYSPVLRKPNHFQTAQQFRESWILSKDIHGNTYVLKERDARGVVVRMYVLDPCRVLPLVSTSGDVFYQLNSDSLPSLLGSEYSGRQVTVPAREIIHDRANTFHHPLIGVPPLCAAHWPAVKNLRILRSAAEFFGNGARPGGILTAPSGISDAQAAELKSYWDTNFTGDKAGKIAVLGGDLKYQQLAENAADSQLVEQMRYSDEQICQAFGIKPYKIGIGVPPGGWKSDDINVEYYCDALQPYIEAMENLLDEGLGISEPLGIWLDTEPLWRMDEGKQAEVQNKLVAGKIKTPDEARKRFNLGSTSGGGTLWGQHQDYPLGVLAERQDLTPVEPEPDPAVEETADEVRKLRAEVWQIKAAEAIREALR